MLEPTAVKPWLLGEEQKGVAVGTYCVMVVGAEVVGLELHPTKLKTAAEAKHPISEKMDNFFTNGPPHIYFMEG